MSKTLGYAVMALVLLAGIMSCEVDEATTGIRITNNTGRDIHTVKLRPEGDGTEWADLPNLLSPPDIADDDYREFETTAGSFEVFVSAGVVGVNLINRYNTIGVTDGIVTNWTVTPPVT